MTKNQIKSYKHQYYLLNKARLLARDKEYYKNNRKKRLAKMKLYYKKNKVDVIIQKRSYHRNRYHSDLDFRIKCNLRSRLKQAIKHNWKRGSAVKDLGCSISFFKQYIESKFINKMTWKNYGNYWEIDHIIPLCSFDLTNIEQLLKAVHYTNLQPLTIPDNRCKGQSND